MLCGRRGLQPRYLRISADGAGISLVPNRNAMRRDGGICDWPARARLHRSHHDDRYCPCTSTATSGKLCDGTDRERVPPQASSHCQAGSSFQYSFGAEALFKPGILRDSTTAEVLLEWRGWLVNGEIALAI